jgi:hypothetical protein
MTVTTTPTITLTLDAHIVQNLRLRWMATSARRALAYARATLVRRSDGYREEIRCLPCGEQDAEWERYEELRRSHEDALTTIATLTAAIESAGLIPVNSTTSGFGGDIANQHWAALELLAAAEVARSGMIDVTLESITQQQNLLERVIARAGF